MRSPLLLTLLALPPTAIAQELNVDFADDGVALPDSFAAAGAPGRWNAVEPPFPGSSPPLLDLAGNPTGVTVSKLDFIGSLSNLVDPSLPPEAQNLLGDGLTTTDIPGRIAFDGLATAEYEIRAYGFVPSQPSFKTTFLQAFPSGTAVGGVWSGDFELGVTHARNRVFVQGGTQLRIDWTVGGPFGSFGIFSGVQIERVWKLVGDGIPGVSGTPQLDAQGPLQPSTQVNIRLTDAAPGAPWWIVIGSSQLDLPLLGGTLVPSPDTFFLVGNTDGSGFGLWSATTPAGLGSGLPVYAQGWVLDAAAVQSVSASNGLFATTF